MLRLKLVPSAVFCPHFKRPVTASRDTVGDRLVDCSDKDSCRDPSPEATSRDAARPFPHGCPVFPSLAK